MDDMRTYSTEEAAQEAGIDRVTLERWIGGKNPRRPECPRASIEIPLGTGKHFIQRRWTDEDVKRLRKFVRDHRYEGRGRPRNSEVSNGRN